MKKHYLNKELNNYKKWTRIKRKKIIELEYELNELHSFKKQNNQTGKFQKMKKWNIKKIFKETEINFKKIMKIWNSKN